MIQVRIRSTITCARDVRRWPYELNVLLAQLEQGRARAAGSELPNPTPSGHSESGKGVYMNSEARAVHEIILTIRAGETFTTYGPWRPGQGFEVGAFRAHVGGRMAAISDANPPRLQLEFFRSLLPEE
jgi:hypothetical protein